MSDKVKKPKSSYLIFCDEQRELIKVSNPELKSTQVIQECSKRWNALSEQQKEVYKQKYQALAAEIPAKPKLEKPKSTKPKSAYINFCAAVRPNVKNNNPGLGPKDLMCKIAEEWSKLSESEKSTYKETSKEETTTAPAVAKVEEVKVAVVETPSTQVKKVRKPKKVVSESVLSE